MADYIHGGSDEREVSRLEKQARFIAPSTLAHFDAQPGQSVLDLATGVGAMAEELAKRFPGIRLWGVDLREDQLRHARARHPVAEYIQADARSLPFDDGTFDRVHCSWLLEHVAEPVAILKEVRRVLKPGGYCHFLEVDNATFQTRPRLPEVMQVMDTMNVEQQRLGGDPFVGRRLGELLREAGFRTVRTVPNLFVGDATKPDFLQAFIEEFAEIFESLDEAVSPDRRALLDKAAAQLRSLPSLPGCELRYQSTIGQGRD